eukprot:CAMPEP_0117752218 /NCGR_PEP_ID=MMETSP0947-20121206/11475_1 /TAXON_ID=44440 /ORGANISM="Chattonella subsalsa, Strain CCMP2191" /LENGTH=359 /DNA_ID=CAMNT_0005570819 /DNA_START=275 /DNA_END=1354 /DNA_ORIENTATION=+
MMDSGSGNRLWLSMLLEGSDQIGTTSLREAINIQNASFLYRELPIRCARAVKKLDSLPMLSEMPSVKQVRQWYTDSFEDFRNSPYPHCPELEEKFLTVLRKVYGRHSNTLIVMARGVWELRQKLDSFGLDYQTETELRHYLDNFYIGRIGLRILSSQYLSLHEKSPPNYIGIVCRKTSLLRVVQFAAEDAADICKSQYGSAPPIYMKGVDFNLVFPYVPEHLHYMIQEILKNSCKAVMDTHKDSVEKPPIIITVRPKNQNRDLEIKVSDKGGGIPSESLSHVWSYFYTSTNEQIQENFMKDTKFGDSAPPLSGLGHGLPLSRVYARYFGGDLKLVSHEGVGVDALLRLSRLGDGEEGTV